MMASFQERRFSSCNSLRTGVLLLRSREGPAQVLREPQQEVVIDRDGLSLLQWSPPLACPTSIWQIATLGIEPLGRTIGVKEADGNACLIGTRGDQALCCIHQTGGNSLSLELREHQQVMDQRDLVLTKERIVWLPAQGQIARKMALNPGQERLSLSLGMFAEMVMRPVGISWVALLNEEFNGRCQILGAHALDSHLNHLSWCSSQWSFLVCRWSVLLASRSFEQISALYAPRACIRNLALRRGASVFCIPTEGLAPDEERTFHPPRKVYLMGCGFSRHPCVKFHPSVHLLALRWGVQAKTQQEKIPAVVFSRTANSP